MAISMCKINRLSIEKYVPAPSLQGGSSSYMKSWCMHVYMEMTDFFLLNVPLFSFVCVEVLRPSQLNKVMSSAVKLPNHTFTGQA